MTRPLVVFAVKQEARPFQRLILARPDSRVLLTGIGKRNAESAIRKALAEQMPELVLTCGFAGGLNPALAVGAVAFSADDNFRFSPALLTAGARPARFHCAERIAATAEEKQSLWKSTGADAVEMESGVIRAICRERNIPSATVRVISDSAEEDLPLDFNSLMGEEHNLSYGKLAAALLKSPGKIGALIHLQKQTQAAAERLAKVLAEIISRPAPAQS
jgi:nucleoside phosphorylase